MTKKYLALSLLLASVSPIVQANSCESSCSTKSNDCSSSCAIVNCPSSSCSNPCSSSSSSSSCGGSCMSVCPTCIDACQCSGGSKTYFATRPLYQSWRPEYVTGSRNGRMLEAHDGFGGALDAVVFGGRSTKRGELATYFIPGCKNTLEFGEAFTTETDPLTVDVRNFGIQTTNGDFRSRVTFGARQSSVGLGLRYLQGFAYNDEKTKWWYVDASMPITHVNNEFVLSETVLNNGGGVSTTITDTRFCQPANMTEAFKQDCFCFGKIKGCGHKYTGVADIQLKLGRQWHYGETCNFASYVGVLIPTSNKPKGEYIFEPIIGHGGSAGLMWGGLVGYNMWNNEADTWHLNWDVAWNSQYLFQTKQTRSMDLKFKPGSRYIAMYRDEAEAQEAARLCANTTNPADQLKGQLLYTPGINILTRKVKVTPGFDFNITSAFNIKSDNGFFGEAGFNFYARAQECVDVDCWQDGPAIKNRTTALKAVVPNSTITVPAGCGNTNPYALMQTSLPYMSAAQDLASYENSIITKDRLDLTTAAHPGILVYMVHGALGYEFNKEGRVPMLAHFGASYEFGNEVSVMKRWNLWGKYGISF